MGDEGEANLVEERNQIKQLQSDISRKKEQLERLKQRKTACEEEMSTRKKELEAVEQEFRNEQNKVKKNKTHATAKTQEAESTFMSLKVKETLQERIPTMCPPQEEVDGGEAGFNTEAKPASADDSGKPIHDTVLVSYVNLASGDKKDDDYKVSYRIDSSITVKMLLKDACSYWGCSRHEYTLCRIRKEEPESLDKYMDHKLQSDDILDAAEQSHLHLVRKVDIQAFQDQSLRSKQVKKENKKEEVEDGGQSLQTLKHGLKNVTSEQVEEPFVKALGAWPGVYRLLKNRQRKRGLVKWHRASLGDFIVFFLLIVLTQLCLDLRRPVDLHTLRSGVEAALIYSPPSETTTRVGQNIKDVRTVPMALQYLSGFFDYQMFNASSMLRKTYTPVGNMRLRIQKAASRECTRPDIPIDLQERCDHVDVSSRQKTSDIEFPPTVAHELDQLVNHSNVKGDPRKWRRSTAGTAVSYGHIQYGYDGSGYQVWFPVNPSDLAGKSTVLSGFDWLLKHWMTGNTRFLAVETTLADYNVGAFVSTSIVVEVSASGAVRMNTMLEPFELESHEMETTATVLDGFRWAFIAAYVMLVRVWMTCEEEVIDGRTGLHYVFSVTGLLDACIGAIFIAGQFMHLHEVPKDPFQTTGNEHFVSYSLFASRQQQLQITEALLLLCLVIRFTILLQFSPDIFRFYKLVKRTVTMCGYYMLVVLPVILSTIYLGTCIWSPYLEGYSTWTRSMMSVIGLMQNIINLDVMLDCINYAWTVPFFLYVYFVLFAFFVNGFVAISAYAYFEVELLEKSHPKFLKWSRDQWLDWALWGSVYRRITGKEPGSSKRIGLEEEEDEERDEDSEGEDD